MAFSRLGQNPIIAAVRRPEDTETALNGSVDSLFLMGGTVNDLIPLVQRAKQRRKNVFVHLDLIRGLSSTDKESVDFVAGVVGASGIITPKAHLIKEAKRVGILGVLHLFVIDSAALENGMKLVRNVEPDAVEIMPGVITKTIGRFVGESGIPLIASGLIQTEEEAAASLEAGAAYLSVSSIPLWHSSL